MYHWPDLQNLWALDPFCCHGENSLELNVPGTSLSKCSLSSYADDCCLNIMQISSFSVQFEISGFPETLNLPNWFHIYCQYCFFSVPSSFIGPVVGRYTLSSSSGAVCSFKPAIAGVFLATWGQQKQAVIAEVRWYVNLFISWMCVGAKSVFIWTHVSIATRCVKSGQFYLYSQIRYY